MSDAIIVIGLIVYVVGYLGVVRLAFEESRNQGYLVMFVPLVWFRFLTTRSERTGPYAVVCFVGLLIVLSGILVGQLSV